MTQRSLFAQYSDLLLVRVRKSLRVTNYGRAAEDPSELGFKAPLKHASWHVAQHNHAHVDTGAECFIVSPPGAEKTLSACGVYVVW